MSNILRAHLKLTRLKSIFTIPSHSYQKRRSTKMAVSTATLSIGGNMLSGQLRRWEPHESKLFQKPRKNFRWFCLNELHLLSYRTKTLNFNPRGGLLPPFHAYGKEADDSFLSVSSYFSFCLLLTNSVKIIVLKSKHVASLCHSFKASILEI